MRLSKIIIWSLIFAVVSGLPLCAFSAGSISDAVYVIPVHGVIDQGLVKFVERGIKEADRVGARAVVIEIDTPGGKVQAASMLSEAIIGADTPTISYVNKEALSAGVLITISSDYIAMAPGSTIGAAETRPNEEKYISAWSKKLQTVAELKNRDKQLVAGMADSDVIIEGLKDKGKILTLTGNEALELGLADIIAKDLNEVLTRKDLSQYEVVRFTPNLAERIAFIATNPFTSPILLTVGMVGAMVEIFTPGFGIAGTLSVLAFSLFFGGSFLAGAAQSWILGLFMLGLFLLAIEMFIPGFGVFGVTGIVSIVGSIIIAFPTPEQAFLSLSVSVVLSVITMYFLTKYLIKTSAFGKIILGVRQDIDEGYTASSQTNINLLNKQGITITPLRPAGTIQIDSDRFDVLTDGAFIPKGATVEVVKVEGNRIIVNSK